MSWNIRISFESTAIFVDTPTNHIRKCVIVPVVAERDAERARGRAVVAQRRARSIYTNIALFVLNAHTPVRWLLDSQSRSLRRAMISQCIVVLRHIYTQTFFVIVGCLRDCTPLISNNAFLMREMSKKKKYTPAVCYRIDDTRCMSRQATLSLKKKKKKKY